MKFRDIINEHGVMWDKVCKIPEFAALEKTPQSKRWHQEGNVLIHTKLVVMNMLRELQGMVDTPDKPYCLIMIAAALCHDLGKAVTTRWDDEKNDYTCPHHGYEGEKIVRRLFFDEDILIREKVCYMVRWHMTMHHLLEKTEDEQCKTYTRLSFGLMDVWSLYLLGKFDALGSINEESLDSCFINDKFNKMIRTVLNLMYSKFNKVFKLDVDDKLSYLNDVNRPADVPRSFNITLMIGVSGAGKDTWVSEHLSDDIMLSRDNIRTEIGIKGEKPYGTKEQEKEVTKIFNERLLEYCKNHKNIVINNTNLMRKYRSEFVKTVLPFNPSITFVYIEPNEMGDRAKRRDGQIKKEIVDGMWDRLDFPDISECDRLLIVKQDKEGNTVTTEI